MVYICDVQISTDEVSIHVQGPSNDETLDDNVDRIQTENHPDSISPSTPSCNLNSSVTTWISSAVGDGRFDSIKKIQIIIFHKNVSTYVV
jgi:hypothetical protein